MNYSRPCVLLSAAALLATATPMTLTPFRQSEVDPRERSAQQLPDAPRALVTVWLTVRGREGQTPADLTRADIQLFEDEKQQSIVSFSHEEMEPLVVGLMLQVSGARHDTLPHDEIDPAISFFRVLLKNHNVGLAVKFSENAEVVRDFTSDPADMERGLRKAASSEFVGCSDLFDAVAAVSAKLAAAAAQRRAIVLVADGHDNCSRKGMSFAVEAALRARVSIYFVNLAYADPAYKRGSALASKFRGVVSDSKRLAESTGGTITFVHTRQDLTPAFNAIAGELNNQYRLTYISSNAARDGKFRSIRADSTLPGIEILAPEGYYAAND